MEILLVKPVYMSTHLEGHFISSNNYKNYKNIKIIYILTSIIVEDPTRYFIYVSKLIYDTLKITLSKHHHL